MFLLLTLSRQVRAGYGNHNDNDGNSHDVDVYSTDFTTT